MEFNRKFRKEPGSYPKQIYFVDKMHRSVLEAARRFGLPVIEPETNNNVMLARPLTHTIYIFSDFEKNKMFHLVERTPNTWILGPTAFKEIADNTTLEIRSRPTYCTFMYGLVFHIDCPGSIRMMKRVVQLLKWMGGLFVVEPNAQTTHMITTSTRAEGYTYCYTFNIPIISPSWVEYCWQQRDKLFFDVTTEMDRFRVAALADLYIAFKGFSAEELSSLEGLAKECGAVVVTLDDLRCTHLVLSYNIARHVNINDVPVFISYVVKEEWLLSSVEQGHRTYENNYLCFSSKEIRKSLWAVEENNENIQRKSYILKTSINNEDQKFVETAKKESQDLKRRYAFEELCLKEKNYLHCLKQLLSIQQKAIEEHQASHTILKKAEAKIIFGNLDKLVEIHEELVENFEDIIVNWTNDAITVKQIIVLKDELLKLYVSYTNNYKKSKEMIEKCEIENKRFRKLLENSIDINNKEDPKDMLIRPVQRLCSVVLQLREINKNTREDNPDKPVLNEAIHVVSDLLWKINNSQEKAEKLEYLFDIYCLIKDCPPDLITSHREFITQFSAQEMASLQNGLGMQVMFFLFNDILEITKIRMKSVKNHVAFEKGTLDINEPLKEKPYKHIATLPLSVISNVISFDEIEEDERNIFGLNVRDINGERALSLYCFKYSDSNSRHRKDILTLIAKQLAQWNTSKSPEDYILYSLPTCRVSFDLITSKAKEKPVLSALDKVTVLFKKTSKNALRKSLSCGDLIDTKNVL